MANMFVVIEFVLLGVCQSITGQYVLPYSSQSYHITLYCVNVEVCKFCVVRFVHKCVNKAVNIKQ